MEKSIVIKVNEHENSFEVIGDINPFEVLGLLRFYEKAVWLQIIESKSLDKKKENSQSNETN
jgi:hypothetical protein